MVARTMALVVMAVCMCRMTEAQMVDLTKPFEVDGPTMQLFHLDDLASGTVKDAVAGGKPGTVTDVLPTLGRFDGGMSCDGVKGWVDVAGLAKTEGPTALTVECWVKFREKAGGDIICRNDKYMMRVAGTVTAYFGIDGNWRIVKGARALPVDRWTHVAMTYDQQTKEVRIYVNGQLDVAEVPKGITDGKLNAGDSVLRLGTNTWSPGSARMDGKLDEVRISSMARQYQPLAGMEEEPVPENTNLVTNPGFESGMHGWRVNVENNALLLWHIEKKDAPQGRAFLQASVPGAPAIISYPIAIARGNLNMITAMLRADGPCKASLSLVCTGTGAGTPEKRLSLTGITVTEEWKEFAAPFEVPKDWPTGKAYVEIGAKGQGKLDIDAVNLVAGVHKGITQPDAEAIGIDVEMPKQSTYMLNSEATMQVEITNAGEKERGFKVSCDISDWQGRWLGRTDSIMAERQAPGQTRACMIQVPTSRVGWFEAKFKVYDGVKLTNETSRVFNVIEPMKGVGGEGLEGIGMNTHMEREPNEHLDCNLGMLSLCGVKWIRGWWGWGMAEKEPGKFDWTEYDRQLDAVHRAGMELMPILLRYYPQFEQAWAGDLDKIERPPKSLEQWGKFVGTTAEHYLGKVRYWEIWNEPVFSMKPPEYAALLKVSYEKIKAAHLKNPTDHLAPAPAQVVGGGGVGPDYVEKVCEAGSAKYMDVMSDHPYSHIGKPFPQLVQKAQALQPVLEKYPMMTKRVWYTEQGTQADGEGYIATGQSELDCATNLVQSYLSSMSLGVEKFFWFSAQTTPRYGWAVYYENYVPRPRLVALNGLARMLKERKVVNRMTLGDGKVACVLLDGKGGAVAALWNLDDAVTVHMPRETVVSLADMLGNPIENQAAAGDVELRRGQPVYVIPGKADLKQLMDALRGAKVEVRVPVEVTVTKDKDGTLDVRVHNASGRHLDVFVTVSAPGLPERGLSQQFTDMDPEWTSGFWISSVKSAAPGTEVTVKVKVEAGMHGICESTTETKVRF